jgi:tRNA-Thr(GGU) m(6)t(6)A37 methyltransferase TsaA
MSRITAQLSVYPLGETSLSPAIDKALRILREHGLDVEAGTMSSLVSGDDDIVFAALQSAFHQIAVQGPVVMVATFSNACPTTKASEDAITYHAIGHVENAFDEPTALDQIKAAESRIVLDPALEEGLQGLETGQRLMVVFYFHRAQGYELRQHPRGDRTREPRGVFALHSPYRPNPIGVTTVDLVKVAGNVLTVRGLDAINGTPVLDLKRQS